LGANLLKLSDQRRAIFTRQRVEVDRHLTAGNSAAAGSPSKSQSGSAIHGTLQP